MWDYLGEHYGSTTVPKEHSGLMRLVGTFLQTTRIMEHERFMKGFTTVIGHTIYAPWRPGSKAPATLVRQLDTGIHEHQHIVQLKRDGYARFWTMYVLSSRARAIYEAEAYTCGLELHWWLSGTTPDPVEVAQILLSYGCSKSDVAAAAEVLASNRVKIQAGEGITESFRLAKAWLEAEAGR